MTAPRSYPAPRPRSGRRGPDAARRIIGVVATGLLAIPLVVALAHWKARHNHLSVVLSFGETL